MVNGALQWVQEWSWGFTNGDPHFTTGDGATYTFNGLGDYWLLQDSSNDVKIQGRIGYCGGDNSVQGTCLNAVAVKMGHGTDSVNVEISKSSSGTLLVWAGKFVSQSTTGTSLGATKHDKITINSDATKVEVTSIVGVKLAVTISAGILQAAIGVEKGIPSTRLSGLYGNFDGDESNDFKSCTSTEMYSASDSERKLFEFGQTCKVPVGQDQMFQDQFSDASESVQNSWEPIFLDEADQALLTNATTVCQQAGVSEARLRLCAFDVYVTGNNNFVDAAIKADKMEVEASNQKSVTLKSRSTADLEAGVTTAVPTTTTDTSTTVVVDSGAVALATSYGALVAVLAAHFL